MTYAAGYYMRYGKEFISFERRGWSASFMSVGNRFHAPKLVIRKVANLCRRVIVWLILRNFTVTYVQLQLLFVRVMRLGRTEYQLLWWPVAKNDLSKLINRSTTTKHAMLRKYRENSFSHNLQSRPTDIPSDRLWIHPSQEIHVAASTQPYPVAHIHNTQFDIRQLLLSQ